VPTAHRVAVKTAGARGQQIVNVFHLRVDESAPFADVSHEMILDVLEDNLVPKYRAMLATGDTLEELAISVEPDPTVPGDTVSGTTRAIGLVGTRSASGPYVPQELCAVLSLKTNTLGRSFRGHMFLPPVYEEQFSTGGEAFDTAGSYWIACAAFRTELLNGFGGGAWWSLPPGEWEAPLVVYSKTRRARAQDPWMTDVESITLRSPVHYLRSRGN
jgi:hypothetical protein